MYLNNTTRVNFSGFTDKFDKRRKDNNCTLRI